jgi:hypothetical protein
MSLLTPMLRRAKGWKALDDINEKASSEARRGAEERAGEPFSSLYLFDESGSMPCMPRGKRDGGEGEYQAGIKQVSSGYQAGTRDHGTL